MKTGYKNKPASSQDKAELRDLLLELAVQQVGSQALVLLDAAGDIIAWHAGAERLFGYADDEIVGQNSSRLFVPEDLKKDLSNWELETAAASGESEDDRWQVRKDGGRIWTSGTLTALRDDRGTLLGFAKIMRNRTDEKSQVETLEARARAAEREQQRKNEFIATLAHEVRSPLSALANAAMLLKAHEPSCPEIAATADIVSRQVDFMTRMADDLLAVARNAAGKAVLQTEEVILQEIIDFAVESCRSAIDLRNQSLQRLLPDVAINLVADPLRLRQVFINLIQNASKYTDEGGKIWVKATVEGDEAVVRVQDTGRGISPEVMPHIFDLFTQAELGRPSQGGLGIGLSIVKDNVTMHGGTVQAASDGLGKGSEFTVRLPLRRSIA